MWLGLCTSTEVAQVQSLVGILRFHMAKKKEGKLLRDGYNDIPLGDRTHDAV